MNNITRTVYGSNIQTCLLLGIPVGPTIKPSTTLNEKFGVEATTALSLTDVQSMKFISIGNGGHDFVRGGDGRSVPKMVQHRTTDASLYSPLPFVLREANNDLSPSERERYAIRRPETHDGKQYYAYYLKRLDLSTVTPQMEYKTVSSSSTSTTVFTPNNSNLNPTPPDLTNSGVNVTTGDYVTATAKLEFTMNTSDVAEFSNACKVIYGSEDYAIISEIALCAGVDKIVQGSSLSSGTFNYKEAIGVQVVSFINAFFSMQFNNDGLRTILDVGATEPLYNLTGV